MRIPRFPFAALCLALLLPSSRAQDAVLVLAPSATTSVRGGKGTAGFSGDGTAATAAQLAAPGAMARDGAGSLFIADTRNHRIRRIAPDGTITTVAGTGTQGFSGDEGPATKAQLDSPSGIAVAADGTLFIADTHNARIRHVDAVGIIHTVTGTGTGGFSGDGGLATSAKLSSPTGLAPGLTGDLYIADTGNYRIRHVDANGIISTVAGDGAQGTSPDGTQATAAHLDAPIALTVRPDGSVLIADRGNNRILALETDGTLRRLSTASVSLRRPGAVAVNSFGDTLIADTGNFRVAQISSNGSGSALGSGIQGAFDPSAAPVTTALGAPVSVLDTGIGGESSQFSAIDRDSSRIVQVSLPQLTFPDTVVATSSTPRSLLLRNAGNVPLSVGALTIPAPFTAAASSSCGTAPFHLAVGTSCTVGLVFSPQTVGPAGGVLQVDAQNTPPERVTLSGNGLRTGTELASSTSLQTSASLTYAGTPVTLTAAVLGGSAAAATGTVTFRDGTTELGNGTLNPAAQATLTTSSFTTGAHTLTARYSGDRSYLTSTSADSALTVAIPPDFTVAATSNRVTVASGSAGALALMLQPVSGVLNQTVAVAVTGLPTGSAINVTPVPVVLASAPLTVNIVFKLPVSLSRTNTNDRGIWVAGLLPFLLFSPRKRRTSFVLTAMLACLPLFLQGCGGGYLSSNSSVNAQSAGSTYPVVVTASCPGVTGATLTHSATVIVVVQP